MPPAQEPHPRHVVWGESARQSSKFSLNMVALVFCFPLLPGDFIKQKPKQGGVKCTGNRELSSKGVLRATPGKRKESWKVRAPIPWSKRMPYKSDGRSAKRGGHGIFPALSSLSSSEEPPLIPSWRLSPRKLSVPGRLRRSGKRALN